MSDNVTVIRNVVREVIVPFEPHAAKTTVSVACGIPRVELTDRAFVDMLCFVDLVDTEVGWLGTVTVEDGNIFVIDELFLPTQTVTVGQCDIVTEGLSEVANQLYDERPDANDVIGRIRFWGHSHNTMSVTPSEQDDKTLEEFGLGTDWMVRGIANKKGAIRFDVRRFDLNVTFNDVPWRRRVALDTARRAQIEAQITGAVTEEPCATTDHMDYLAWVQK